MYVHLGTYLPKYMLGNSVEKPSTCSVPEVHKLEVVGGSSGFSPIAKWS